MHEFFYCDSVFRVSIHTPSATTAAPLISTSNRRLSSCPSGPTRVTQYSPSSQERLCEYTCSFRVSVFGRPAGTRSRTVFRCCSGEPHVLSRALGIYGCPEAPEVPDGSGDQWTIQNPVHIVLFTYHSYCHFINLSKFLLWTVFNNVLMHVDHAFIAREEMWSFNIYSLD